MKFKDSIFDFISDKQFSNGLIVKIAEPEQSVLSRLDLVDEFVKDKKVIHLGCCDHLPLIEEKKKKGIWLHERITKKSEKTLGIDINKAGIDFLQNKMGYNNVICADITNDKIEEIENLKWDYIVIGEILEHVNNPVLFLKTIAERYNGIIDKFIITVPNAFSLTNYQAAKNYEEIINSDHRYWFTPYTLAKIGYEAGLIMEEFFFVQETYSEKIGLKSKMFVIPYLRRIKTRNFLKKHPVFREGILSVFKIF